MTSTNNQEQKTTSASVEEADTSAADTSAADTSAAANTSAAAPAREEDWSNVTTDMKTPDGHFRRIHRYYTEFLRLGQEDIAMTPEYDPVWEAEARRNGFPAVPPGAIFINK